MSIRPTDGFLIAAVMAGLLLVAAAVSIIADMAAGAAVLLDLTASALEKTTHP